MSPETDSYSKDLLFLTCIAFCVITFEPIMIQTCSAPQNDHLIFSSVKDIKVGVEIMTRNCRKMIKQTGDSLLMSKHSIQLSAVFLLLPVRTFISKSYFSFGISVIYRPEMQGSRVVFLSLVRLMNGRIELKYITPYLINCNILLRKNCFISSIENTKGFL